MNDRIDDLAKQVADDTDTVQEIAERWTGYNDAIENLRLAIEELADYVTNL
jgi:uncharacterized coiled-coil protein SlyX